MTNLAKLSNRARFLPPLLARATLSAAFVASGRKKLADPEGNADYFKQLGIPAPETMVRLVSATEVSCGSLLGAGLLTRVAALPLIPVLAVAILTARRDEIRSFADLTGIYEFSYILLLSYLALYGGGVASVDSLLRSARPRQDEVPENCTSNSYHGRVA
jgi:putative oxidoreductase